MPRFKVLAGMHEQADRSKPLKGPDGQVVPGRFERRTYRTGDVVETDKDLVALFGAQKFEALGGRSETDAAEIARLRAQIAELEAKQAGGAGAALTGVAGQPGTPALRSLVETPATAPGGQVSSGWQGGAPEPAKKAASTAPSDVEGEAADDGLDAKTVAELRAQAEEEEIDLKGAHSKADILARMRGQQAK